MTPEARVTERIRRARLLLRRAALVGVVLTFVVVATSAYLRLAQAGLGCADWPACYGVPLAQGDPPTQQVALMRAIHRIAAAAVGFVVILVAAVSFSGLRRDLGERSLALALGILTVFLALLGAATPGAQLPAVTLGNLLGGMLMLAAFQWLRESARAAAGHARRPVNGGLLVGAALLALQIALGALVSATRSGASCPGLPGCGGGWEMSPMTLALLDPWQLPSPLQGTALIEDPARAGLHMLHRMVAALVVIYWCAMAVLARAQRSPTATAARRVALLLLVQCGVGAAAVAFSLPLWLAVAHNALAALAVLAVASSMYQSRCSDEASVSAACQIVISK
jgi:cytochrome c oxidase assembly protein subunit 15